MAWNDSRPQTGEAVYKRQTGKRLSRASGLRNIDEGFQGKVTRGIENDIMSPHPEADPEA